MPYAASSSMRASSPFHYLKCNYNIMGLYQPDVHARSRLNGYVSLDIIYVVSSVFNNEQAKSRTSFKFRKSIPYAYGQPIHVWAPHTRKGSPYKYTRTGLAHTRMGQNTRIWDRTHT